MKYSLQIIIVLLVGTFSAFSVQANELVGQWRGELKVGPQSVPLAFNVSRIDDELKATMDSPAQGATDIPVKSVSHKANRVIFDVAVAGARYEATISEQVMNGVWRQGGQEFPLILSKAKPEEEKQVSLFRPQEPSAPFPYEIREVSFKNQQHKVELAGTLTLPSKPVAAVVLVSGSGPQDRDQLFMGHKTFWVLADHLTRQGIAVLRYDDRGVAKSTGSFQGATSYDFAVDAGAAIEYLSSVAELNGVKKGIVGHSEGGLIAPITASFRKDVAFVSLLAGPGQTGNEISIWQIQSFLQANGLSDEAARAGSNITKALNAAVLNSTASESLPEVLTETYQAQWRQLPPAIQKEIVAVGGGELPASRVQSLASKWTAYFLAHDPGQFLRGLKIPVLAIHGDKDTQMSAELNLSAIEAALVSGTPHSLNKVEKIAGVNHLFQTAKTGLMSEYAQIEETISPKVLTVISDWILTVVK